ncbi:MAG: 1-deoxy-D-xylulose-5-phosphate reductoisomerase [Robiginitomaculum sp.]
MAKTISILGATGSIGDSTLSFIRNAKRGVFDVVCLTANSSADKLADLALEFKPKFVVLAKEENETILRERLAGADIEIGIGGAALIEAGAYPADFIMASIIGAAGLEPTLAAVKQGTHIGLANKECLVCAGDLFMESVERSKAKLLPVDSEHNAIFQVLNQKRREDVKRLILTASGGPFRTLSAQELGRVKRAQALAHPVWKMGAKITIDSASLMNKGLELIEASYLFDRASSEIDIIIHPQSIIHGLVEYVDGSVLAQMGSPDMCTPIAYSLAWPQRMQTNVKPFNLADLGKFEFFAPDAERFPALRLARAALEAGGGAPTVLNAANEIAVAAFLDDKITFLQIPECVETVLASFKGEQSFARPANTIEEVLDTDNRARIKARAFVEGK